MRMDDQPLTGALVHRPKLSVLVAGVEASYSSYCQLYNYGNVVVTSPHLTSVSFLGLSEWSLGRFDENAVVSELVFELLLHLDDALAEAEELVTQVDGPHSQCVSECKHHGFFAFVCCKPTQCVAGSFGERHPLFDASLLNGVNEVL